MVRGVRFYSDQPVGRLHCTNMHVKERRNSTESNSLRELAVAGKYDGGTAELGPTDDAAGPTSDHESQLMRELSLTDGPILVDNDEANNGDIVQTSELAGELDRPQHVQVLDSSVWEPSTIHEEQGHTEPNFLPPFASEENKAINRQVQVIILELLCLLCMGTTEDARAHMICRVWSKTSKKQKLSSRKRKTESRSWTSI